MKLLKLLYEYYKYWFFDASDPRSSSLPLIGSPIPVIVIVFLYVKFALKWGPNFMKDRNPYNVEKVLRVYNVIQILCSGYIVVMFVKHVLFGGYNIFCEPLDTTSNPRAMLVIHLGYLYFCLKIMDLMDTVFFVLRKKWNQISFLHIYHHSGMILAVWVGLKFVPGGQSVFIGGINSAVHTVMYAYYLVASMNKGQGPLWWKKYITQLQILQFFIIDINLLFIILSPDCAFPKGIALMAFINNTFMICMFSDFYYKAYIKKKIIKQ